MVQKRIANYNDWRTEGLKTDERWVQYLRQFVLQYKKRNLKIFGELFSKICLTVFEKNAVAQWRRAGLNFHYHFMNRGEILNKMAMLKYFST